jgi:glyoxylase-like metal-dependent hydrolase (beta-lactamase superfamily II)
MAVALDARAAAARAVTRVKTMRFKFGSFESENRDTRTLGSALVHVQEVAPGLWRWTGLHPEWKPEDGGPEGWDQEVGCVYYEGPDAVVLVDPLAPPEDEERFWEALDRDVERAGKPVRILLTVSWHGRSAEAVAKRYGAAIDGPLPGGVETHGAPAGEETVFWLPEHGALVFGDVVLGADGGGVRLCPESWLENAGHAELREALRPLLDLPVERLLVSHGEPVLAGAHSALALALG